MFAVASIRRGTRIGRFEGVPTTRDGAYVLWVLGDDDEFRGIRGTSSLRFLNHSTDPNAEFRADELFALRAIRPDEEITCHYGEAWESDALDLDADGLDAEAALGLEPIEAAALDAELDAELDGQARVTAGELERRSA